MFYVDAEWLAYNFVDIGDKLYEDYACTMIELAFRKAMAPIVEAVDNDPDPVAILGW
jgi:hypothetical protein